MENTTVTSLEVIIPAYRMHTQTFDNALKDISESDAKKRIENKTNHIIWMAGNLVNCRYWLANILGIPEKDPNEELFKEAKALDTNISYPSLESLKQEWHKISPVLFKKLKTVSKEELQKLYDFGMKIEFVTENYLNMVGMSVDRESYLFGQIGLMRRILGYPGMSYEMSKEIDY